MPSSSIAGAEPVPIWPDCIALRGGYTERMGAIRPARPVNLICGFIANDPDLIGRAVGLLARHVGEVEELSERWPFDFTDYYEPEMGPGLIRQFASFADLIDPVALVGIKTLTNDLERRLADECGVPRSQRVVNLDPGYVTLSKLVLATTKDYGHRVYLRDGIYAESTLHYRGKVWESWPWTYPDYADGRYFPFLDRVRERLRTKLSDRFEQADRRQEHQA